MYMYDFACIIRLRVHHYFFQPCTLYVVNLILFYCNYLTVNSVITAIDGTAILDEDYEAFVGSSEVTFSSYAESVMIYLPIVDDEIYEEDTDEVTISMAFKSPTAGGHYMGHLDKMVVNIIDDDEPGITLFDINIIFNIQIFKQIKKQ